MFYTNIFRKGNTIYHRYIDKNGSDQLKEVKDFKPYLFIEDDDKFSTSKYKNVDGKKLKKLEFDSPTDFDRSKYNYSSTVKLYGHRNVLQQYITRNVDFDKQLKNWDKKHIKTAYLDIETTVSGPLTQDTIDNASEKIYVITVYDDKDDTVYVLLDDSVSENGKTFNKSQSEYKDKIKLFKCSSEVDLLQKFVRLIRRIKPNIITHWNGNFFDTPYIVNALEKKVATGYSNKLSPIEKVSKKIKQIFNEDKSEIIRTLTTFKIEGIAQLDYMELYKKFNSEEQESYALDYILRVEKVGSKYTHHTDIPGHLLYREYFDDSIIYNITDVMEMVKLEKKKSFIELACLFAFYTSSNIDDIMGSVTPWHNYIHTSLYNQDTLHPIVNDVDIEVEDSKGKIVGAYVEAPINRKYKNVVTYDFGSLYPNIIKSFNISNDTIKYRPKKPALEYIDYYANGGEVKNHPKMCTTGNGARYNRTKIGMMANFVDGVLTERAKYKKKKKLARKPEMKQRWDLYQLALKILANSLYGCMSNKYFIFYDRDVAESITATGQVAIKYMKDQINIRFNKFFKTKDINYVVALDTDSNMLSLYDKVFDLDEMIDLSDGKLQKIVNQIVNDFCIRFNAVNDHSLVMEREMICDDAFFVKKKNYCMRVLNKEGEDLRDNPFYKIMGIHSKKKSKYSEYTREKMEQAYILVLDDERDRFLDFAIKTEKEFREKLDINHVVERISVKNMEKYSDGNGWFIKGAPYNVKAAFAYNKYVSDNNFAEKYGLIKSGDKIKMAPLVKNNPFGNDRIAWLGDYPKDLKIKDFVDISQIYEKNLLKPILFASRAAGWHYSVDSITQHEMIDILDVRLEKPVKYKMKRKEFEEDKTQFSLF